MCVGVIQPTSGLWHVSESSQIQFFLLVFLIFPFLTLPYWSGMGFATKWANYLIINNILMLHIIFLHTCNYFKFLLSKLRDCTIASS